MKRIFGFSTLLVILWSENAAPLIPFTSLTSTSNAKPVFVPTTIYTKAVYKTTVIPYPKVVKKSTTSIPNAVTTTSTYAKSTTFNDPCIGSNCHKYATCVPYKKTYKCTCKGRTEGNGITCTPFCAVGQAVTGGINLNLNTGRRRRFIDAGLNAIAGAINNIAPSVPNIVLPSLPVPPIPANTTINLPNVPLTFPRASLGAIVSSKELCGGTPCAQATCIKDASNPKKAVFVLKADTRALQCRDSIAGIGAMTSVNSISVEEAVSCLSYVTSTKSISVDQAAVIVEGLYDLIHRDNFQVSQALLQEAMQLINNVATIVWENIPLESLRRKEDMAKLVEVLESFAHRLNLPTNELQQAVAPIFYTNDVTVKVVDLVQNVHEALTPYTSFNDFAGTAAPISINLPTSLLQKAYSSFNRTNLRVSYIVYHNDLFFPSTGNVSHVACANIENFTASTDVDDPITVTFHQEKAKQGKTKLTTNPFKDLVTRTQCVVWDKNSLSWTPSGCQFVVGSWPPQCSCTKLANFAMLIQVEILPSAFIMAVVSYVGCGLSILGLFITICVFLCVRELRQRTPTPFIVNISLCLLIANILFVAGTNQVENRITCYVTTALLHYFLLATWFWMTCNAANMYMAFVKVGERRTFARSLAAAISYLLPLVIVTVTVVLTIIQQDIPKYREDDIFFESTYNSRHVCWLHSYSLNYGFLVPVGVMALVNLVIFCFIMYSITCKRKKIRSSVRSKATKSSDVMKAFQLVILMGLTWVFGFLLLVADNVAYKQVMAWLFTILNSTQGFLLFYVNCVRNDVVRKLWWDPCLRAVCCLHEPNSQKIIQQTRTISTTKT